MNTEDRRVDFYWDIGSTNTYFALKLIKPILVRTGADLNLIPLNLGYVFRSNNYVLMDEPANKMSNRLRDLNRWADKYDLPFRMPDKFPIKTSRVLRGALVMKEFGKEPEFIEAIFSTYWERNDASIENYEGMIPIVESLGMDSDEFMSRAESDAIRQQLISSTNRGIERGVFGAPSMVVGNEIFWGKDRLEFVEEELMKT